MKLCWMVISLSSSSEEGSPSLYMNERTFCPQHSIRVSSFYSSIHHKTTADHGKAKPLLRPLRRRRAETT